MEPASDPRLSLPTFFTPTSCSRPVAASKKKTDDPGKKKQDLHALPPAHAATLELAALRAMLGVKPPKTQAEKEPPDGPPP